MGDTEKRDSFIDVVAVWGNKEIIKLETRGNTTFALTSDNILYGWGDNSKGQLGNGTTENELEPIQIRTGVKDIKAGLEHTVVLDTNRRVYAWGSNEYNQINSSNNKIIMTPYMITDYSELIGAGDYQTYYHGTDFELCGIGKNERGMISNNLHSLFYIQKISCGDKRAAAIDLNGQLWVWGDNSKGQLGVYTMTSKMSFKEKETVTETIEGTDTGGKTSYDVTAQSGGEYILKYVAKTDGTYTFNTVSNNGTSLVVAAYKDSNFTKPYKQTSNNGLLQVGAEKNSTIYLRYINPDNISFSATTTVEKISDTVEDNQTVYAILYDSPYFEEGYAADGKFLGSRYLGSNLDERYEYNTNGTEGSNEFFKNYLSLVKDKNVVFVIFIRDITFDTDENGISMTLDEIHKNYATKANDITRFTNDIITNMYKAYMELEEWEKPGQIPQIYIETPDFSAVGIDEQEYNLKKSFLDLYLDMCKKIYKDVENHVIELENGNLKKVLTNCIAGLYYGKEDPFDYYKDTNENDGKELKKELSDSIYALIMKNVSDYIHDENKKLIWFPYTAGQKEQLKCIGEIANTGKVSNDKDLCDIVIIQPNYFYYEMNISAGDTGYMETMNDIYQSAADNCVKYWDEEEQKYVTAGGEKTTDTLVSFQIEYDMSLVSGRDTGEKQNPVDKADKLAYTISVFHDLIYGNHSDPGNIVEQKSFGIYAGGPNEQGYTWEVLNPDGGMNVNTHSNRNFVNLLGDMGMVHFYEMRYYLSVSDYYWNKISNEYNGKLIYDITHMLFYCDEDGSYIPDPLITFFGQDRIKQMFKLD